MGDRDGAPPPSKRQKISKDVTFGDIGTLDPKLVEVCMSKGLIFPTAFQQGIIAHILNGEEVIGIAEKSCGKTVSFAVSIINQLIKSGPTPHLEACIVCPTNARTRFVCRSFEVLGSTFKIEPWLVCDNETDIVHKKRVYGKRKPRILIAMPKALAELILHKKIDVQHLKYLVFDEADVFKESQQANIEAIVHASSSNKKTYIFSKGEVDRKWHTYLSASRIPIPVEKENKCSFQEQVLFCTKDEKFCHLVTLLEIMKSKKCIILTKSCDDSTYVAAILTELGMNAIAMINLRDPFKNIISLKEFKDEVEKGDPPVLVCSDSLSWMPFPTMDTLINYGPPMLSTDYTNRMLFHVSRFGDIISLVEDCEKSLYQKITKDRALIPYKFESEHSKLLEYGARVGQARDQAYAKISKRQFSKKDDNEDGLSLLIKIPPIPDSGNEDYCAATVDAVIDYFL